MFLCLKCVILVRQEVISQAEADRCVTQGVAISAGNSVCLPHLWLGRLIIEPLWSGDVKWPDEYRPIVRQQLVDAGFPITPQ